MFSKNTLSSKRIIISEGEINAFSDKQKLREFITTRPALQKLMKAVLQVDWKDTV